MAIVQEPKPLPSPLTYVPAGSAPHKVANQESWWSLADRPDVRVSGMSANDLCFYNFRTRVPSEINWYLQHKVGCRTSTRDGKNYVFTSADDPGIVHLPQSGAPHPVNEIAPSNPANKLNAWFGLVGKAGTQFVLVGIETVMGPVVSLDDPSRVMAVTSSVNRIGPGFGASGGVAGIYIVGVSSPGQLNGHQEGDWDFNLALGGNWGKIGKAASKSNRLKPLVDALAKLGARTPSGVKQVLRAHPDKYAELVDTCRSLNDALGMDPSGGPRVLIFDLPLSGGVEVSGFYGVSNFNAVWDSD
jgi:hypothetical protein